ncbi:site-specific integrase [Sphingobacterium sp. BIGb0116]|uniref:tyrosine-type recombinase/integrase n=1 Tax=Sphingobacterium sp. BIGb0116 TaxID=2940619 RepID=UPI0021676C64|nr:site-specific integrase [Sphingobacterium sp. BIGb0116]MCS4164483.1 integrase [Sphingobacterium sp. BIGb0116]
MYDANSDLSKDWFVSYYFLKPIELQKANEPQYQRFKIFDSINSIKSLRERRSQLKIVYQALSELLEEGFSPFAKFQQHKLSKFNICECIEEYLKNVEGELKPKTYKLYKGRLNFFKNYLQNVGLGNIDISDLTKQDIFDFVKYFQTEKSWSNKTYNHYLQAIHTFLQYYIDNYEGYLENNVCGKVKKLQVFKKGNRPFSNASFKKTLEWLKDNDPYLYNFCRFIYYSCMRPEAELRLLQIMHIDLQGRKIMVPCNNSKSKITQYIPIDDEFYEVIKSMRLERFNPNYFVFGLKDAPAEKPVCERYFRKRFNKVHKHVFIEDLVTMYSFKHTRCIHLVEDGEKLHNIIKITRHRTLVELMDYLKDMGVILGDEVKFKSRSI